MGSVLGLSGLVSGANTDDIIKKMTDIESKRIDSEKAKMSDLLAKQDAWHKVRDSLTALRTSLDGIRMAGPFQGRTAAYTDDTIATVSPYSGATPTSHTLNVTQLAQTEAVGGYLLASDSTYLVSDPTHPVAAGTMVINGKNVSVTAQDTLQSLKSKINGTSGIGVTADVVKVTQKDPGTGAYVTSYRLTLTSQTSGAAGITLANADPLNDVLANLGIATGNGATHNYLDATLTKPQDAIFKFDGQDYQTTTNAITDLLPRMSLTLKKPGSTTITISQDTSQAATAVQSFVDALNSTLDLLKTESSYDLSTGQHGPLANDSTIQGLATSLRSIISTQAFSSSNPYNNLTTVGITTGVYGSSDYGKVLLDKNKLANALADDEQAVAKLFGGLRDNVTVGQGLNWQSAGGTPFVGPQSMIVSFGGTKTIDSVYFTTPDGATTPTQGIKDFNLYYQDTQGSWQPLRNVSSFTGTSQQIGFDPVSARGIKLEVTATYNNTLANIGELDAYQVNPGIAVKMYQYVKGNLTYATGTMDVRDKDYTAQIKELDDKIQQMTDQMTEHQTNLRNQFDQMEAAMAKLQSQGASLTAMMGGK